MDMLKMLKNFFEIQSSQITTVVEKALIILNDNK